MFEKVLRSFDKPLNFIEDWTLFITVFIALMSLFINVVLRYGFNYCLAWSEELVRDVIIYTTLIGCSSAIRKRSMIKVDATIQLLPKSKVILTFFSNFTILIFAVILIYYGWELAIMQLKTDQHSIILRIPLVYLFAMLPFAGVMMLIRSIQVIYFDFLKLKK
jgi:C4-dicarboxylate transporter, DctQ subunit